MVCAFTEMDLLSYGSKNAVLEEELFSCAPFMLPTISLDKNICSDAILSLEEEWPFIIWNVKGVLKNKCLQFLVCIRYTKSSY